LQLYLYARDYSATLEESPLISQKHPDATGHSSGITIAGRFSCEWQPAKATEKARDADGWTLRSKGPTIAAVQAVPTTRDNDEERIGRIEQIVQKLRAAVEHLRATATLAEETATRIDTQIAANRKKKRVKKR
jgi:hypothetical protein